MLNGSIYDYCIENKRELKKFDIIQVGDEYLYYEFSDGNKIEELLEKYCKLVKCTIDDLKWALNQYVQDICLFQSHDVEINDTARSRSIIHHHPEDK